MKERIIYDKKYYKVKNLLENIKFLERITDFKKEFSDFGCPIPEEGFPNREEYEKWEEKFAEIRREIKKRSRDIVEKDEAHALDETMLRLSTYGLNLRDILKEFDLNPENKDDYNWIENYFFFGIKDYPHDLGTLRFDLEKEELWLRILPHTNLRKIPLKGIKQWQKLLPEYRERNKGKDVGKMERDKEVRILYEKYRHEILENEFYDRARPGKSIASRVLKELKPKYPELNENLIKKIVGEK